MNRRIYWLEAILLAGGGIALLPIDGRMTAGLLLGGVVGILLFLRTATFWNAMLDAGVVTSSAGHFLKTYGIQGIALLMGVAFPQWFNIFAIAFGLVSLKLVIFLYYLIPWKGGTE